MNFIKPKITIKRKNNYPCSKCNKDILIGDKYYSVKYDDGFRKSGFGAFHLECYEFPLEFNSKY